MKCVIVLFVCYFILPVDCLVIFFISEFSIYIFTNALNNHGKIYVYNLYMGVKVVLFYRGKSKHNWSTVFHSLINTIFVKGEEGGGVRPFLIDSLPTIIYLLCVSHCPEFEIRFCTNMSRGKSDNGHID